MVPPGFPFRSTAVASRSSISTSRVLCSWNKIPAKRSFLAFTEEISSEKNGKPFKLYYLEPFSENTGIPDHKSILIIKPSFGKKKIHLQWEIKVHKKHKDQHIDGSFMLWDSIALNTGDRVDLVVFQLKSITLAIRAN